MENRDDFDEAPTLVRSPCRRTAKPDGIEGQLLLGKYRILRCLAKGGMGVIYLARVEGAAGFIKPVVVKRVLPSFANAPEYIESFIHEAQVLAALHDPGIANVIDFEKTESGYLMVLEYVHGFEVKEWTNYLAQKGERIPCDIAVMILISVLTTLQHVHGLRREKTRLPEIVHRDISPANIMIDAEGRIKLVDFGIALFLPTTPLEYDANEEIPFMGKLPYAAPELLRGRRPSAASDIFACGVTLHELLTGRNEFVGHDTSETIHNVMTHHLSPIGAYCRHAPEGIDNIIGKATQKKADERFQSAGAFAEALRSILATQEYVLLNKLAGMVQRDFHSEEMILYLDTPSLEERDMAWQTSSFLPESVLNDPYVTAHYRSNEKIESFEWETLPTSLQDDSGKIK